MTERDRPHVAVRFVKNWAGVWSDGIKSVVVVGIDFLLFCFAVVGFCALVTAPMLAYQVHFHGIDSFSQQSALTGWDWTIVMVIEVVWLSILISGTIAAERTYYGD